MEIETKSVVEEKNDMMMTEVGYAPSDEDHEIPGSSYCHRRGKIECMAFINQLIRKVGSPLSGMILDVYEYVSEDGKPYSVVECRYHKENEDHFNMAVSYDSEPLEYWDSEALEELRLKEKGADITDGFDD